jgi:ABC-2 type transport system permease protein
MLKVLVDRFHPLAGWTFPQIAFLYGLGLMSHGLQVIFFIETWWIGGQVVHGGFDRLLLRPMNVFFQFMARYVNLIGCLDMVPAVIIFSYGCHAVGFAWSLPNALKLLGVLVGATLVRASLYGLAGSTSFWTRSPGSIRDAIEPMIHHGTLYPLSIYPRALHWALTFLVPVGFISFYPACEFLGKDDGFSLPLGLAVWTPVVGVAAFTLMHEVFRRGLRRYESTGS